MGEKVLLSDFDDYLRMLADMDKIGIRRKIVIMEGYINKIKTTINNPKTEKKMVRLGNDHTYMELEVDMEKFVFEQEFDNELFGRYNNEPMFIKK